MQSANDRSQAVKAQALLLDPESFAILWANAPGAPVSTGQGGDPALALTLERAVPMADTVGVREALRAVADTGIAQHLCVEVVAMARKSVALVISIYRLPDGNLLLLTEHALHVGRGTADSPAARRSGRRAP